MASLYADENFNYRVVEELREKGHDILTVREAGQAGVSDNEVLRHATEQQRIVLTFNEKDFIRLHRQSDEHTGIVICTVDRDVSALAQRIHEKLTDVPVMAGKLERVRRPSS